MCKPRTKIECEVDRLHRQLAELSDRQKAWALKTCLNYKRTVRYRGRKCDIEHFIIATTKGGWQVLRHFYMYAFYRRKELDVVEYLPVMEQWFKQGKYVFYSLTRQGFSYCSDTWNRNSEMAIRRNDMVTAYMFDPRDLDYAGIRYERVLPQFRYIKDCQECSIGYLWRAVNTDPIWETIFKQDVEEYLWGMSNGFTDSKQKTTAVRIARRHKYDYMNTTWRDLIDSLIFLHKDIHNPTYVCPVDLSATHNKFCLMAENKKRRIVEMFRAKAEEREERARLARMQRRLEEEKERATREKNAIIEYPKARKQFFGVIIEGQGIEIKCLQSVQEFMDEGMAMKHCVFGNSYYDIHKHPNSLILSARYNGERAETIEVDLRDYHIVQSQGKHNQNSPYHDTILKLMSDNMDLIKNANRRKKKAV